MPNPFEKYLPSGVREKLKAGRESASETSWYISDCAQRAAKVVEDMGLDSVTQRSAYSAVGYYAGLSTSRVEKVSNVGRKLGHLRGACELTFDYFERGYNFGDEGEFFLEFCEEYEVENGKQSLNTLEFLFRKHILGDRVEDVGIEEIYDPHDNGEYEGGVDEGGEDSDGVITISREALVLSQCIKLLRSLENRCIFTETALSNVINAYDALGESAKIEDMV